MEQTIAKADQEDKYVPALASIVIEQWRVCGVCEMVRNQAAVRHAGRKVGRQILTLSRLLRRIRQTNTKNRDIAIFVVMPIRHQQAISGG
jgi:hypothetical protein